MFEDSESPILRVKFIGGREIKGKLIGKDQGPVKEDISLLKCTNMILDEAVEFLKDPTDPSVDTGKTRKLGLVVVRANMAVSVLDEGGFEEIDNPYGE
mmetsp:Transcript_25353/g.22471  ORF Transcript_25353/g.22471 Transcript_25353/m.22471 type:complete len:98 (+) Transcript_25353:31-324(+)